LIERLDNLRYFEPLLALAEARRAMDEADPPQRALLLGVAASCHRLLANIPAGKGCISLGFKLVDNFYNCLIQGDLLQRLSYLVGDEARFELALAVNKEAFLSHAGDVRRLGQCCVDRGNFLFSLERFSEATMEFRRSMELLDIQEDKRNMFSAQQNLATCLVKEKELKEALKVASKAVKLEDAVGVYSRANLQWLLGDIKSELTEHLEAHTNYAKALELYLSLSFRGAATKAAGQGALVGMKLVGCQITLGRIKEATRTSKDLVKLATPLSGNAVVSSALLSLGYSQNLTEKLVTNLTLQVERGLGKIAQAQEVMLLSGR
jgi:tetratricopeptide (TPR) repeat protein